MIFLILRMESVHIRKHSYYLPKPGDIRVLYMIAFTCLPQRPFRKVSRLLRWHYLSTTSAYIFDMTSYVHSRHTILFRLQISPTVLSKKEMKVHSY